MLALALLFLACPWYAVGWDATSWDEVQCFNDAIPKEDRSDISYQGQESPVKILFLDWTLARVNRELATIVLEEKVGFNVNRSTDIKGCCSWAGIRATVPGCDPVGAKTEVCDIEKEGHPFAHMAFEIWNTYIPGGFRDYTETIGLDDKTVPVLKDLSYQGEESLCISSDLHASVLNASGLDLSYFRFYDANWFKANQFFSTTVDVDAIVGKSPMACNLDSKKVSNFQGPGMNLYLQLTDDAEGVVKASDEEIYANCKDGWWHAPSCRANPLSCIPVITVDSWLVRAMMQWAAFYNMPFAVGTYDNLVKTTEYQKITKGAKVLFYETIHLPQYSGLSRIPTKVVFPISNLREVRQGIYRTAIEANTLAKVGWRNLNYASSRAAIFFEKYDIYPALIGSIGLRALTLSIDGKRGERKAACEFLRSNDLWKDWMPPPPPPRVPCIVEGDTDCPANSICCGSGRCDCIDGYIPQYNQTNAADVITVNVLPPTQMVCVDVQGKSCTDFSVDAGLAETSVCSTCPAGFFCPEGLALPCMQGRYCAEGSASPTLCPEGYRTLSSGAKSQADCKACSAGTSWAPLSKEGCAPCPVGKFAAAEGQSACTDAQPGYFVANDSSTMQMECPAGQVTEMAAMDECVACSAGKFQGEVGQSSCQRCKIGTYAGTGSLACIPCDAEGGKLTTAYPGAVMEAECLCPEGTYRDEIQRKVCHPCKEGMTCIEGSDMLLYVQAPDDASSVYPTLEAGRWSASDDPLNVFNCANDHRCPGGKPGTCAQNTQGIACARCIDEHYGTAKDCKPCSSIETSQFLFPIIPAILLPIVLCGMYWFFRDMPDRWGSFTNGMAALLFLVLNHYQMLAMARATNLVMPAIVQNTWNVWAHSEDSVSLFQMDCAGYAGFQTNFILKALGPLIVMIWSVVTFFGTRIFAFLSGKAVGMDPDRLFNVYFSIVYAFFTGIASISMSLFKCQKNPNGKRTLKRDLSIICNEDEWNSMLGVGIVSVLVYCIGCIALFSYITYIAPQNFQIASFQKRWKFLFIKFRLDTHWWGLVFLAKSVILNIGPVAFDDGPTQLYWMMSVCVIYLVLMVIFFPWRIRLATILDCMVHTSVIVVLSLLTWFIPRQEGSDDDLSSFTVVMSCAPFPCFAIVSGVLMYPWVQQKLNIAYEDSFIDKATRAIKESMQAVAVLKTDDIRRLYTNLSQHDRALLEQASFIIKVELLGASAFKLTTSATLRLWAQAKNGKADETEVEDSVDAKDALLHAAKDNGTGCGQDIWQEPKSIKAEGEMSPPMPEDVLWKTLMDTDLPEGSRMGIPVRNPIASWTYKLRECP